MNTKKQLPIRVGLIGLGAVSNNHILSLLSIKNVKIVALCDIKEEKLLAKQKEHSLFDATLYTDYQQMLKNEHLDTVHIMTPHYLHAPMTVFALECGTDVFLEKPIGISEEDIENIRLAECRTGRRVCVSFQNRFNPTTICAKKLAEADGGVISAYAAVVWDRNRTYYEGSDWRGFYKTEGGGVMINQAIHTIDLLYYFLGEPKSIKATTANHHLDGIIEVEDMCEGQIIFKNGTSALFYATTAFDRCNVTELVLRTKNHKIEIRNGLLYLDDTEHPVTTVDIPFYGKEVYGKGHQALITLFYDAIISGSEMPVSTMEAAFALRMLLAAYKSFGKETEI